MSKREKFLELAGQMFDLIHGEAKDTAAAEPTEKKGKGKGKATEEKPSAPVPTSKVFSKKNPATGAADMQIFHAQWGAMTTAQQNAYIAGEIDSLGNPMVTQAPEAAPVVAPVVPEEKALTIDDVKAALTSVVTSKGQAAAVELLKKFGANKVSELKASDYAALIAETQPKEEASLFD